ncbi:hypothetical protein ACU686_09795 [Yinghuangia aomiensis]
MTTIVWQTAAVTAALLLLDLLRTIVNVSRATEASRTRIAALHQALADLDHAAGTTPTGGTSARLPRHTAGTAVRAAPHQPGSIRPLQEQR